MSRPTPQIPWLNRVTGFTLQTRGSVCFSWLKHHCPHSFQVFLTAFLFRWGQKTLSMVSRAMFQPLFLGRRRRGCSRLFSILQPSCPVVKGLSLVIKLIPLPTCSTEDSPPGTDFVLGAVSSVHLLTQVPVGRMAPRSCYQLLWSGVVTSPLEALHSG